MDRAFSPWVFAHHRDPGRCPGLVWNAPLALKLAPSSFIRNGMMFSYDQWTSLAAASDLRRNFAISHDPANRAFGRVAGAIRASEMWDRFRADDNGCGH